MTYTVRDNVDQGLGRLPTQFDDSPLLQSYLETYLQGVDELQALAEDYIEGIRIETAIGAQLDIIGRIVGESRLARNDEDYRTAIKTRIILNTSRGQPRDIYAAARAVANSDTAMFWEHYPASLVVSVGGENFTDIPNNAREIVDDAAASGVKVGEFLIDTDNNGLVFAEILFEEGTIVTDLNDDLIDDQGNFIEYQLVTSSTTNTQASRFAEISFGELAVDQTLDDPLTVNGENLTVNGATYDVSVSNYSLNGDTWVVTSQLPTTESGSIFFEALR